MEKKSTKVLANYDDKHLEDHDVEVLYTRLIEKFTCKKVQVVAEKISDGKYGVEIISKDLRFWAIYKSWDSGTEVIDNVLNAIEELALTT